MLVYDLISYFHGVIITGTLLNPAVAGTFGCWLNVVVS